MFGAVSRTGFSSRLHAAPPARVPCASGCTVQGVSRSGLTHGLATTSYWRLPHLTLWKIGEGTSISMRATVIAHFKELRGVRIGREVFIGPGAIILPGVTIGDGAVVTAGSVVTASVPAATMVRGNPAVPVAKCGVPMRDDVSYLRFAGSLKPIAPNHEPH